MKTSHLESVGYIKRAAVDSFENGESTSPGDCMDDVSQDWPRIRANDVPGVVAAICKAFGVEPRALLLNCCGEAGRIDIQRHETGEGWAASEADIAQWKAGNLKLWSCDYTLRVQRVTRETVELPAVTGCEWEQAETESKSADGAKG